MDSSHGTQSPAPAQLLPGSFGTIFANAVRFWEPRRILYNLALTALVLNWLASTWPHFQPAWNLSSLLLLAILAALANVCYCAAYFVDITMQYSAPSSVWRKGRWGLWLMGTFLAVMFANYWIADEIYPYVHP
jgi:hypothetical protein